MSRLSFASPWQPSPWQSTQSGSDRIAGIFEVCSPLSAINETGNLIESSGQVALFNLIPTRRTELGLDSGYVGWVVRVFGITPQWLQPLLGRGLPTTDADIVDFHVSERTARAVQRDEQAILVNPVPQFNSNF